MEKIRRNKDSNILFPPIPLFFSNSSVLLFILPFFSIFCRYFIKSIITSFVYRFIRRFVYRFESIRRFIVNLLFFSRAKRAISKQLRKEKSDLKKEEANAKATIVGMKRKLEREEAHDAKMDHYALESAELQ